MYRHLTRLVLVAVLLTGCATQRDNMPFRDGMTEKPSTVVITEVSGLETPCYIKAGTQGLLMFMMNEVMAQSIEKKIKILKVQSVVDSHYYEAFRQGLEHQGFQVRKSSDLLRKETLQKPPIDDSKHAPYDFRFLKEKFDVEYALVLEPISVGLIRHYYDCIPLGAPKGYTDLLIYLVNLNSNLLEGYYHAVVKLPIEGEWDTPPEYDALMNSAQNALVKALREAYTYFFFLKSQHE